MIDVACSFVFVHIYVWFTYKLSMFFKYTRRWSEGRYRSLPWAIKGNVWQRCSHPPRAISATMKHTSAAEGGRQPRQTWISSIESAASSMPGNFARACHARPQTQETASSTAMTVCARTRETCLQRMSGTVSASMRFVQIGIGIAKHRDGIMVQARHHHHRLQAC